MGNDGTASHSHTDEVLEAMGQRSRLPNWLKLVSAKTR